MDLNDPKYQERCQYGNHPVGFHLTVKGCSSCLRELMSEMQDIQKDSRAKMRQNAALQKKSPSPS